MVPPAPRVAIVHDWLLVFGGAEQVLASLLRVFPDADLFSVLDFMDAGDRERLGGRRARTSFVQRLPFAERRHRFYLPLMPLAVEQFDLSGYDVVVSSSYAVAKGVITGPDQLHVAYVHSPMRYAWDLQHQYLDQTGAGAGPFGWIVRTLLHRLRLWDQASGNRPDLLVANSRFIARRIEKTYRRPAEVVYPPVDVDAFTLETAKDDYYLTASRLVPYKRIDLIVEAFAARPDRRLVVVGDGPERARIERLAAPNVTILGHRPTAELRQLMQRARAFVFAAEEDFGIVPVEAQACGTPVIAYGKGGARETVDATSAHPTGVLFPTQTVAALNEAVDRFESSGAAFDPAAIRQHASRFSTTRFEHRMRDLVGEAWTNALAAR
jgi:glycosyltransferase involved in cell wall biosynthesis